MVILLKCAQFKFKSRDLFFFKFMENLDFKELGGEAELLPNPFGGADFAQSMGPGAENCVIM